jgi:nitroimidazol reductase NimA-like FMN-containing flavoprotein (pyridoxamine 5'-phosphate oxidase superfamily)
MKNEKTKVRRVPERGQYDAQSIQNILSESFLCHVAFVHQGYPVVIPTIYAHDKKFLYVHGATSSRMLKSIEGENVSVCVSMVDGIVVARSAFHHSLNYRSVVIFGKAERIQSSDERLKAMELITNSIIPRRWEECRPIHDKELKATSILRIPLNEASAKVRTGPPKDEKADYDLPIWAGVIPIKQIQEKAIPDPDLGQGILPTHAILPYL